MDWLNVFFILTIGLIQVFFSDKLASKVFDKDSKSCSGLKYDTPEYKECNKDFKRIKNTMETSKFIFMMIVGISSLISQIVIR